MERKEVMDKLLGNIRSVWDTNPNLPFGSVLALIEENTNTPFMALRDEDIIKLSENMDVSDVVDLWDVIQGLTVSTVYDQSDSFAGYTIIGKDNTPLKDMECILENINVDYPSEIESLLLQDCKGFKSELVCDDVLFNKEEDAQAAIQQLHTYYRDVISDWDC